VIKKIAHHTSQEALSKYSLKNQLNNPPSLSLNNGVTWLSSTLNEKILILSNKIFILK